MALSGPSASPPMASSTGLVARMVLSSCGKHAGNPTGCGDELDTFIIVTVYRRNHGRISFLLPFSFAILVLFIIGGFHWVYVLSICILPSSIGCKQPLVLCMQALWHVRICLTPDRKKKPRKAPNNTIRRKFLTFIMGSYTPGVDMQ